MSSTVASSASGLNRPAICRGVIDRFKSASTRTPVPELRKEANWPPAFQSGLEAAAAGTDAGLVEEQFAAQSLGQRTGDGSDAGQAVAGKDRDANALAGDE